MAVTVPETLDCPPITDEPLIDDGNRPGGGLILCVTGVAKIAGGEFEYTYFQTRNRTVPVVVAPGIFGIKPPYDNLGMAIAETGNDAITIRPGRKQKLTKALHPAHMSRPLRFQSQGIWSVMRDVRDKYEIDQFDFFSHSLGGPTTMDVVNHHGQNVRSVILAGAAGLDGQTSRDLGRRLPTAAAEIIPAILKLEVNRARAARHLLYYALQNPLRTPAEAYAVSRANINRSIERARDAGIKIGRLQFKADPFFPISTITEEAKQAVDKYSEFEDETAGHMAPLKQPREVAAASQAMRRALVGL